MTRPKREIREINQRLFDLIGEHGIDTEEIATLIREGADINTMIDFS
jgi:hypothetical protein